MNTKHLLLIAATLVGAIGIAGCKISPPVNYGVAGNSRQFDLAQRQPTESLGEIASIVTLPGTADFDHFVGQDSGRVLVDFYADWCGPCKLQGEILQEVAENNGGYLPKIVKVNVDHHPELAEKFQVSALPTLLVFEDGEIAQRQAGFADRQRIASLLGL